MGCRSWGDGCGFGLLTAWGRAILNGVKKELLKRQQLLRSSYTLFENKYNNCLKGLIRKFEILHIKDFPLCLTHSKSSITVIIITRRGRSITIQGLDQELQA